MRYILPLFCIFFNQITHTHTQLLDTKSTDRKQTLLHYIANVVKEKYVQVSLFYNELHYVEKAAAGESHRVSQPAGRSSSQSHCFPCGST